jgi:phosphoribosylformylglycinamidine synthase
MKIINAKLEVVMNVRRIFVTKKPGFDVEARSLYNDLRSNLGISGLTGIQVVHRYDIEGISEAEYQKARTTVFAELPVDQVADETLPVESGRILAVEYLPGQYDQQADSAAQCLQILSGRERPVVKTAKLLIFDGELSDAEFDRIATYCINPLESQQATLDKPETLETELPYPADIPALAGFTTKSEVELEQLRDGWGLAMSRDDLAFCQRYFCDTEKRNPTLTEIRVLDTYWSDHCRHTTFLTRIEAVEFGVGPYAPVMRQAYERYLQNRDFVYGGRRKAITLMDLATLAMKEFRKRGWLEDLEESDEINACSIVVNAEVDGRTQEWLVMFKNETHNHPTEIEPFGGAATCLGGAIRDPLSGRSYVYHAMRVTGSGDPRAKVAETLQGKLPQRKITTGAATGFSSYGNQIGLATGQVVEIYDPGYLAKRMEIGAVIGAAPRTNVRREQPHPGDVVVLVGGRTGRDGCGGATGSSKEHTEDSLHTCGAEVQKGNAPTERKIQRLFRQAEVSKLIKKCNDFGAGGVAVAIGELAPGLEINLDAVPKKYEGLDGTELAISESQERMAVLLDPRDVLAFDAAAASENLETTVVAVVTEQPRLKMFWRDRAIVDISREFLDTNGVEQTTQVSVAAPDPDTNYFAQNDPEIAFRMKEGLKAAWQANLARLNVCSQKGLGERFDSTIGAGTVLMPFGGKYQLTPIESMAAKLPVLSGETTTGTVMAYGYNPDLSKWSPFHGALYAVVEAVAKIVATGGDHTKIRLTLQEYFAKPGKDPARWGRPFAALLGAYYAQQQLGIPAIGGKDSMSGTFKDLDVPPTLVAFALTTADVRRVISPEFKAVGSQVAFLPLQRNQAELPDFGQLDRNYRKIHRLIATGKVVAVHSIRAGGIAEAVAKMCFGNRIGFAFATFQDPAALFAPDYGSLVVELAEGVALSELDELDYCLLGQTQEKPVIVVNGESLELEELLQSWQAPLEKVFPAQIELAGEVLPGNNDPAPTFKTHSQVKLAKPRVLIPVFPGTNCEYDTQRAFEQAGAQVAILVMRNLTPADIEATVDALERHIDQAQMVMLPGGFSAGDEPEGSGKFIATVFRNPRLAEAVMRLLRERDGLMLGICNGFQALVKLGLVPYGEIRELTADAPTLTFNTIGRHVSCLVRTKVVSKLSPWLAGMELGVQHTVAVSHGEGRFVAGPKLLNLLAERGQIATQYVDFDGNPSNVMPFNPNGSVAAIEGVTSPDGRVFGKMGHSERKGANLYRNVPEVQDQDIFAAGVKYFS